MQYRCNHCDITFESDKKEKPRCPECMGIHDVEHAAAKNSSNAQTAKSGVQKMPLIIIAIVIAAAVGYFVLQKETDNHSDSTNLDPDSVEDQLSALGLSTDEAVVPYQSSKSLDAFAQKAAGGKSDSEALHAVFAYLTKLKSEKKWTAFPQTEPRFEIPISATELVNKFDGDSSWQATSYEMACVLFAAGQSLEIEPLQLVEILHFKKEKTPADPSAIYSRYAVASGATLLDPWSGREEKTADVNIIPLNAATATAPFYAHRSLSKFAKLELPEALKDNKIAVELAPENATFKIHRGKIFLGSSAVQEAVAEFEKAKKAKDWALTKVALAQMSLMTQNNLNEAEADIRDALKEFPEYHQAHSLLAALYMMRGNADSAKQELEIAQKISPASPEVAATFAQLYAMQGDSENAIESAKKAVRLSKENFQSLMILAQVYRATARFDEMRETAQKAIDKAPSETVKQELAKAFNLAELDDEEDEEDEEDETLADNVSDSDNNDTDDGLELNLPTPSAAGDLKLNLKNDNNAAGTGGLRLGGSANRPGLGSDLQLEMNQ